MSSKKRETASNLTYLCRRSAVVTRPFCEIRHGGGRPTRENTGPEARVFQQPLARLAAKALQFCTENSTCTSGVATATVPKRGHLPLNFSTSCLASESVTPFIWNWSLTELNSDTSGRTGLERSILPWISTAIPCSGIPSAFAITWTNSTPQEATADRNSSAGVTSSPGHPFCSGPSIT